jgi:hypothetical protein
VSVSEEPDHRHCRLLRVRSKRPRRSGAAEQRGEFAPCHVDHGLPSGTRLQRFASSEELWKWIDAHQTELGVGRPHLDRDPPHVAPIDGKEYAAKRGRPIVRKAGL